MATNSISMKECDQDLKEKGGTVENSNLKRFIKLVKGLNTVSKTGAEKALRQIRDDILKHSECSKYLCDNKAFKSITQFLDFPNEKLLNLSISILATCCVQKEARTQVYECNAIPQIAAVLKNISQDGVQNRACRLVANLAQSELIVYELHKHKVVESIVKILSSNSSSGTQQSGIRALRLLWESLGYNDWSMRQTMLQACVAEVTAEALKIQNKELTQCALRALEAFTQPPRAASYCAHNLPQSLYPLLIANLRDRQGCQVAVNLTQDSRGVMMLNQNYALKSVIDLFAASVLSPRRSKVPDDVTLASSVLPGLQPMSSSANDVTTVRPATNDVTPVSSSVNDVTTVRPETNDITLVSSSVNDVTTVRPATNDVAPVSSSANDVRPATNDVTEPLGHVYLLSVLLCTLCKEVTGRTQLLNSSNGTSVFLHLLEQQEHSHIKSHLYQVLLQFTLEPNTLQYLARNGLVQILVKRLECYTKAHGRLHRDAYKSEILERATMSYELKSYAPPGWVSPSPSPSPPHVAKSQHVAGNASPRDGDTLDGSDDSWGDCCDYSPICSSEGEGGVATGYHSDGDAYEPAVHNQRCKQTFYESIAGQQSDPQFAPSFFGLMDDEHVIYFLEKLTHGGATLNDLVSMRTIDAILNYKVLVNNPKSRVLKFLEALARKEQYYCRLLDDEFVLRVHRAWCRPKHGDGDSECSYCQWLAKAGAQVLKASAHLAETGLGEGEMAHRLLTGSPKVQFQVALTVPLVIRNVRLLDRLLYKYKAYSILTWPLYEGTADQSQLEDIAFSIRQLFNALEYTNPQVRPASTCRGCNVLSLRPAATVTFRLDDGSLVAACKQVLSDQSPVFEAMFRGGFQEAEQSQVRIHDVSVNCLKTFVRLVEVYCACTLPANVATLLELVAVADRFLVAGLSAKVLAHVINSKLDYTCCKEIYQWGIECKLPLAKDVSTDVMKYIFTAKMSQTQLTQALDSMIRSSVKRHFLDDLKNMISDRIRTISP
ncbi:uncharacterized protein LOC111050600 [Nilaparvata lugens]|uniref:uncharacterized protein LOC111050600 n=1 Tax=Nilaparvata lugens TaxID=108931 RepID=UPI00193CA567|nr:uncharacterized protein LOC111050600 [Nilaparvata lugens]